MVQTPLDNLSNELLKKKDLIVYLYTYGSSPIFSFYTLTNIFDPPNQFDSLQRMIMCDRLKEFVYDHFDIAIEKITLDSNSDSFTTRAPTMTVYFE